MKLQKLYVRMYLVIKIMLIDVVVIENKFNQLAMSIHIYRFQFTRLQEEGGREEGGEERQYVQTKIRERKMQINLEVGLCVFREGDVSKSCEDCLV